VSDNASAGDKIIAAPGPIAGCWQEAEAVWVLAGSAGASSAVQQFLNAFEVPPPVAFVYAQHYDPARQEQLLQFTAENPAFKLVLGEGVHKLAPGRVIIIPPQSKVIIGRFGDICSTDVSWGSKHTPDINELLVIFAAANLPSTGVIIFSGMGSDGSDVLKVLDASGTRLWAQTTESAVCSSMPRAAIATGLVHRTGTPVELAEALTRLYSKDS